MEWEIGLPWFNRLMEYRSKDEWPWTVDVPSLLAGGWRPHPFSEFVVRIHSRPDLSSDYCYLYGMADQSWRSRPARMTHEVADQTAMRIGEHVRAHDLRKIALLMGGGEPLLAGRELISHLVGSTRSAAGPGVAVDVRIQTNAIGLDDSYLEFFRELGVRIGVSLDRDTQNNDRHRRFASGRGGDVAVLAGLKRLARPRFRHMFSGLLCTIDLRNDPMATYQAMDAFDPPQIDFLLPYGTWEAPPPGRVPEAEDTPYADWLTPIFRAWYEAPRTRIRLFDEIMTMVLGGVSRFEAIGLSPMGVVVIEADGAIAQTDTLDSAHHAAVATGLHVAADPLDAALLVPGVVGRQLGALALCAQCRECPFLRVCGGGLYSHRYRAGAGFSNPSVYCPDLMRIISLMIETMTDDINGRRNGPPT
jgi:uncharacterized protein